VYDVYLYMIIMVVKLLLFREVLCFNQRLHMRSRKTGNITSQYF